MPRAVKLSDELLDIAQSEAKVMKRSMAGQVEYWATLGQTIEASGVMNLEQVRAVLAGKGSVHTLSASEDALYLELLGKELESFDGSDTGIIQELKSGGHPIAGEDEKGNLTVTPTAPSGSKVA